MKPANHSTQQLANFSVVDIETDGLDPTVIHVASVRHKDNVSHYFDKGSFNNWLATVPHPIVMHNGVGYDIPVLTRLWGSS